MRSTIALLVLALAAPLSGCMQCAPQLDVYHCTSETGRCDLAGEAVAEWASDPSHLALFEGLDELLRSVDPGAHGHRTWSEERAQAFWAFYNVPADREDKQVFLRFEGSLFHVRVLAC
jgi:hypothetical protein